MIGPVSAYFQVLAMARDWRALQAEPALMDDIFKSQEG
jgi:hypothetical protein